MITIVNTVHRSHSDLSAGCISFYLLMANSQTMALRVSPALAMLAPVHIGSLDVVYGVHHVLEPSRTVSGM